MMKEVNLKKLVSILYFSKENRQRNCEKNCLKVSPNLPEMETECLFLLLFVYSMIGKKKIMGTNWGEDGRKVVLPEYLVS